MLEKETQEYLNFAVKAAEAAGSVLLELREWRTFHKSNQASQVKSFADIVSEKLIFSLLEIFYPKAHALSEEKYEKSKSFKPEREFWVIDALDGTASFCDGYDGFCVQMAYINNSQPVLGVVHAPALGLTYLAAVGRGAYLKKKDNKTKKLLLKNKLSSNKTYIDSRPAKGFLADILKQVGADKFLEMGSYGLKICKVAEGEADIFLKAHQFKIWDTAPGGLILREAGGKLTLWNGSEIDYSGRQIYFKKLAAASPICHQQVIPLIYDK